MTFSHKQISVPVWWSSGSMMVRRDCLPANHPEHPYNYIIREFGVRPEDYGVEKPYIEKCHNCGHIL